MKIQIAPHTLLRAKERGATEEEIIETVLTGVTIPAKLGRSGKAKVFPFKAGKNGQYYEEKKLEVFYIVENDTLTTVTVYVFYGKFS